MKNWVLEMAVWEADALLAVQGKCLMLPAVIAEKHAKFLLSQWKESQYTAETVTQKDQKGSN